MAFLPITREEMEARGWDAPDIVVVTGDAYVDHPSRFARAGVGWVSCLHFTSTSERCGLYALRQTTPCLFRQWR